MQSEAKSIITHDPHLIFIAYCTTYYERNSFLLKIPRKSSNIPTYFTYYLRDYTGKTCIYFELSEHRAEDILVHVLKTISTSWYNILTVAILSIPIGNRIFFLNIECRI